MASTITLKLTDRAPKKHVKRLPATLEVPEDATVEDVKKQIAKAAGISDFNRVGLFYPSTKKTLKDRRARISSEEDVMKHGEVLVKDLGPQVAWKTVFIVEYLGPILLHLAVLAVRPYVFRDAPRTMSTTQWLSCGMILGHFVKRELETLFVHRFSANTMPVFNIFKNSFFYWMLSGALCAVAIYSPMSLAATATEPLVDYVGLAVYTVGEICNGLVHLHLASLRSKGGTERKIPNGLGFSLVTCPNYMFEVISWLGIIVTSRSWAPAVFIAMGIMQMQAWAKGKEKAYRQEFGDKYKKKRYTMLPGIV